MEAVQGSLRAAHRNTRRELVLLQEAFYSGPCGVLKVLDQMLEHDETAEAQRTIRRFGRHVNVIMRRSPRRSGALNALASSYGYER